MVTIRHILEKQTFKSLKLLTNEATIERVVETVDLTEVPDVASYTSSYAFILSTAVMFKDDQTKLIPFIKSLSDINVAALGIKTSRFLKKIEPEVIEYANQIGFALIEVSAEVTLGYVVHQLFDFILDKKNAEILYALDIQRFYSDLVLKGASPQQILDELCQIINTPTLLFSPFQELVSHSACEVLDKDNINRFTPQIKDTLQRNLPTTVIKNKKILDKHGQEQFLNVYPIKINMFMPYYLVVIHNNTLSYPISDFSIEQSTMVLSYIIYKNTMIENTMIQYQTNYFKRLINNHENNPKTISDLIEQGFNHGLINTDYYKVIACKAKPRLDTKSHISDINRLTYDWLANTLSIKLKYSLIFYDDQNSQSIILLQHQVPDLEIILQENAQSIRELLTINISFGLGNAINEPFQIKDSYFEAIEAINQNNNHDIIKRYSPQGLMTLFNGTNERSINYFIEQQLKDLVYSDNDFHLELRKTLKAYLDNQCEITATAEALKLHRNTIGYRIKKSQELLQIDLNDPKVTLALRLALDLLEAKTNL